MTILDDAAARLREAGIESPRSEARLLLAHAMGVAREDIISGAAEPDAASRARFGAAVARRSSHEPFAYIVGHREFFSRDFAVGPGVLIPRPESEMLVEEALRRFPRREEKLSVLDLGTGTGCLLLAFLAERPEAEGLGIDMSEAALGFARRNAQHLGLAGRARFLRGDWGESLAARFDAIFVNPPYVKTGDIVTLAPEVAVHEPASALDGGPDGLKCYTRVAPTLAELLSAKGCAFVEIGEGQAASVSAIFENAELSVDGTVTDFARIHRCLVVMVAAEQHSRAKQKKQL
jgi:release factor glutamine methyltransferase